MKQFFTLMAIALSMTAYAQTVIHTETFPTNTFNTAGAGGQSGSYIGNLSGWSLKSSASSIIEVDNAPTGGKTRALRLASGTGSTNNPRVDTATSPNMNLTDGTCTIFELAFEFEWYVETGQNGNYDLKLQFSGDGGATWNTVWTNTDLPSNDNWNKVTVSGGIPNTNSYWLGGDFKFRLTSRRSSGSSSMDVRFDNFRVLAISGGSDIPSFHSIPQRVQGSELQPGAVYLYKNVLTVPETLDAIIKIEADSNAHVSVLDNPSANPARFQPKVANDGTLGNGSETSDRGWVQFSITFIKGNSYKENNVATDADDTYTTQTLTGLRYQHFDVDGFENGSGVSAGYFREVGAIASPMSILVNVPTDIGDGGIYSAASYNWRKMLGEIDEHDGVSSDLDVTFTALFSAVSVVRFRLGFEFVKGNGGSTTVDREYATEFNCLSFPQQSTLPVKLISFSGSYRNNSTTLTWETENEVNFDHFEIERSSDGVKYSNIGYKAATSSVTTSRQTYMQADDLTAVSGSVFYYRLRMVDRDGQFKFSNVIMIRKESKTINGITLSPNPVVNGQATVRFSASATDIVSLRILDMGGKVVLQQQNKAYAGNNSVSINNLDRLQPGVYVLQMANGEEMTTVKFNIAR
jgi:hypothetical protein